MKKRRKAIDCKLVAPSKSSPGYFKYEITIQEVDGTVNKVPAYGKDMQDAISRLVWTERVEKASNKTLIVSLVIAWITALVLADVMAAVNNKPAWIIGSMGITILLGIIIVQINKYFRKE